MKIINLYVEDAFMLNWFFTGFRKMAAGAPGLWYHLLVGWPETTRFTIPQKGRLIQGWYKPIRGSCAIYLYPGVEKIFSSPILSGSLQNKSLNKPHLAMEKDPGWLIEIIGDDTTQLYGD